MFYFFSTEQTPQNIRHHKGRLFEDLLSRFLDARGYRVDVRQKYNSLEYDLVGRNTMDGRALIGEAKAHEATITGETLSAFVGKFATHHFANNGNVSGLFLSTNPLSPDGEDYFRELRQASPFQIERHNGSELEKMVRSALRLPTQEEAQLVASQLPVIQTQHLLHTNHGTFVVLLGSSSSGGFPDQFALLGSDKQLVTSDLLKRVRDAVPALQELEPVGAEKSTKTSRAAIPADLLASADWLDFRHPAGPQVFVGREDALVEADKVFITALAGIVLEIKARSGVGKSSLLIALANRWREQNCTVELHDARDVHSAADVLAIVQRFTKGVRPIRSLEEIPAALAVMKSKRARAVFMVDQFEATFQIAEVYRAYEFLAMCLFRAGPSYALVFARKDDLLTTHDDIQIDFERLRSMARTIPLEDFTRPEAFELLGKISAALPKKLNPRILSQVLEFAEGFPWLLKRTMAHVARTIEETSQQELASAGLHLEDLFEEELAELDEIERGYLSRIAAHLPATLHALLTRYEGDAQLSAILEKLTARRILRFSAGTYDTYNDVFKDFLLYERLPERGQSGLFKMSPFPVMKAFRAIGARNRLDVAAFGKTLAKSTGGTYNTLRELCLAGLVERRSNGWCVPQVVRDFEHQNRLGEYVRQALLRNSAVSAFITMVEKSGEYRAGDVQSYLRDRFPFVQARDDVWDGYARTFVSWLSNLRFVSVEDGIISGPKNDDGLSEELGNLHLRGRGSRPVRSILLPSRELSITRRVLKKVATGNIRRSDLRRSESDALHDLTKLGSVEILDDGSMVARHSEEAFLGAIRATFSEGPHKTFLKELRVGKSYSEALTEAFGVNDLSEATRNTLGRKLANWARALELFPSHARVHKSRQPHPTTGDLFGDST